MNDDKNDQAGYGRPPEYAQFKKGKSGNPKGRPKGSRNLKTELKEELSETISVREGNKTKRITKQRAMLKQQVAKAMQGSERAASSVFALAIKTGADGAAETKTNELLDVYEAILARRDERLRAQREAAEKSQMADEEYDNDE